MFNVIRIPTKFSKTIKRMSNEERLQVFDLLIKIWDWGEISPPDNIVWDVVQLIYGEWMNMDAKNGVKREKSSINLCSEWPGEVVPSDPGTRVEYSRVEENRIEDSAYPENTEDKEIQNTKLSDEWIALLEWEETFTSIMAQALIDIGWKPKETVQEFVEWVKKKMEVNKIEECEKDFYKLKSWLSWFVDHFKDKSTKNHKSTLWANFCLHFNLK